MASAKEITGVDKKGLAWIEILDSDGGKATYHKGEPSPAGATVHIVQHNATAIEILPDGKGGSMIQQSGPGLPETVNFSLQPANAGPPGMAGVVMAGWGGGVFIYGQREKKNSVIEYIKFRLHDEMGQNWFNSDQLPVLTKTKLHQL